MEVAPIRSERLDLVSMTPSFVEALLEGRRDEAAAELDLRLPEEWPDPHDEGFLRLRLRQMQAKPELQEWLIRALTLHGDDRPFVGHLGFHGPPGVNALRREDALEVGYTVRPEYRSRGYATEAVKAMLAWAREERGIRAFIASVAPDNEPSLRIVHKLGFVHVGEHWDEEDGLELEYLLEFTQ